MKNVKHVFFDLDRTLWDFETNSKEALLEICAAYHIDERINATVEDFIREYKRINEIFWNNYRIGAINKEQLRFARFEAALTHFNVNDAALAEKIGRDYINNSPRRTALVPGAIDLLEYLKPNYDLHIITNGFAEVQQIKMENSRIDHYFDEIVISELVGHKKPRLEVFRYAENAAGSVAGDSIMIGDHFEADIMGAVMAGWKAIYYEPENEVELEETFLHVKNLHEIKSIL